MKFNLKFKFTEFGSDKTFEILCLSNFLIRVKVKSESKLLQLNLHFVKIVNEDYRAGIQFFNTLLDVFKPELKILLSSFYSLSIKLCTSPRIKNQSKLSHEILTVLGQAPNNVNSSFKFFFDFFRRHRNYFIIAQKTLQFKHHKK